MGKTAEKIMPFVQQIMVQRFGHDTLISLATLDGDQPSVRIVDGYYEDGAFYSMTHALSNKMQQIQANPAVALCGEWFTARGMGENMGHPREERNAEIASKLRAAFAEWYDNGHTDESNPHTCILRIRLTRGVLMHHGKKYTLDFTAG